MSELTPASLQAGGLYNWKNQPERLVYLGLCDPRNGRWHQFAKVDTPSVVWCEVLGSELSSLEKTREAGTIKDAEFINSDIDKARHA